MSNPIIRLEALKQFVRNIILPLSEDVSGLKDSAPSSTDKQNWDSAKKHADSAHAPSSAQANVIETVKVNGTALTPNDKAVDITVPNYSNFGKSGSGAKAGLVPAPSTTAGNTKYLREDGTWAVPPDTDTKYTHPTTAGNKHIPSGGSAGQILRWSDDGTAVWGADNNTTYTPATLGNGYGTCSTAAATAAKVVSLSNYALVVNGIVEVKFTYDVPANATLNINNRGAKAIYYKGEAIKAGTIKAGDIATFVYVNSQYHLVNIDKQIDTRLSVESGKIYIEYEQ